jgi:phospholipase/carboxylesterase
MQMTRREFCTAACGITVGALLPGCSSASGPGSDAARLTARPSAPTNYLQAGLSTLGSAPRDGLLYIPAALTVTMPLPLMVALHGYGGSADATMSLLGARADAAGIVVLAIDSRGATWDGLTGNYGADVEVIDRSLRYVFRNRAVVADRISIEGFSDGASYALGLGLANGDLFSRILSFSPGFIPAQGGRVGSPRVFDSHGTLDTTLPIEQASRTIVPALRADGYDVTYREFTGGHEVPADVLDEAFAWLA